MKMSAIETTSLPPGATVQHYAVIDAIGMDAQYAVYRAECSRSLRSVLLYEYLPGRSGPRGATATRAPRGRGSAAERALAAHADRLRASSAVVHPALPVLEEVWQQDGTLYAVGAWQPGRCLLTALAAGAQPPAPETILGWARTLGEALDALHRQGLVHGNVSPGTTRLLADGRLVLPPVGGPVHDELVPAWVAPEQHPLNPRPAGIGPWTDVYQLCALLYHALSGLPPPVVTRRWEGAPLERLPLTAPRWPQALLDAVRLGLSMIPSARPRGIPAWLDKAEVPPAPVLPTRGEERTPAHDGELPAPPAHGEVLGSLARDAVTETPPRGEVIDAQPHGAVIDPLPHGEGLDPPARGEVIDAPASDAVLAARASEDLPERLPQPAVAAVAGQPDEATVAAAAEDGAVPVGRASPEPMAQPSAWPLDAPVEAAAPEPVLAVIPGPADPMHGGDPAITHELLPASAAEGSPGTGAAPGEAAATPAQDADVVDVTAQPSTRRAPPGTPAWVWVAAALSVAGVVGIVIAT